MGDFFKGKRIHWREGVYLTPQHLQQLQNYIDDKVLDVIPIHESYESVINLKIDDLAISNGIFKIQELESVFKNGRYINYKNKLPDQTDNYDLSVNLNDYSKVFHAQNQITLYVCFSDKTLTVEESVVDKYDSSQSVNLLKDLEKLSILPDHLLMSHHIGIPVAKIMWKNNTFLVDNTYQYPVNIIKDHHVIYANIIDFINEMRTNAATIASQHLNHSEKREIVVEQYQSFFPDVLVLEAKLLTGILTPIDVFMILHKMLGSLSILKFTNLPMVKKYNHYNIAKDIITLMKEISDIFHTLEIFGERIFFKLSNDDENINSTFFEMSVNERVLNSSSLFLLVEIDHINAKDIAIEWIKDCKIIGKNQSKDVIYHRSRGIKRNFTENTNFGENVIVVELLMKSFQEYISVDEKELCVFNTTSSFLPKNISLCLVTNH